MLRSDRIHVGGLCLLLLVTTPLSAQSVRVGDLLALCARADAAAGVGVDAAFCDWYALPCDCKLMRPEAGVEPNGPRWCLPDAASALDAARAQVLAELEQLGTPTRSAEPAVAEILARLYPCPTD